MRKKALRDVLAAKIQAALDAGDTQGGIAKRAGYVLSQQHVGKLAKGKAAASVDTLEGLAKALHCEPWELLVDDEEAREEAFRRILSRPANQGRG